MKKHFINFRFLIIALIFIVGATVLERNSLQPESYRVDTEKFSKKLFEKETEINSVIKSAKERIKPVQDKKDLNLFETFSEINFKELKNKGLIVLVYINDSLKFWTDNSVEVDARFSNSKLNNSIVSLNNAWYYVKHLHDKNLEVFGLVLLRNDYSFENEFLVNSFQSEFELPSSIQISMIPLSYSYDIYDLERNYLFSLIPTNTIFSTSENWGLIGILYFLGIAFLVLFFNKWFRQIATQQSNPERRMLLVIAFLVFIRYLMLEFKYPLQVYTLSFFNPDYFAASYLFPSLGDFLINSLLILFFIRSLFFIVRSGKLIRFFKQKSKSIQLIFCGLSIVVIILFFNYIIQLLESLVLNSSLPLEAHKVLELNLFSLVTYVIFGMLLSSLVIATDRIIFINKHILKLKKFLPIAVGLIVIYGILAFRLNLILSLESLVYLFGLFAMITYVHFRHKKYHYSFYIVLIIFGSIYLTLFIDKTIKQKNKDQAEVLISKLINERDRVAEHLLVSIRDKLQEDNTLKEYVEHFGVNKNEDIHNLLKNKYFSGYLEKYNLDLVVCCDCDNFQQANKLENCANYYGNLIDEFGDKIKETDFYYLDNHNSRVSYLGSVTYKDEKGKNKYTLWVSLDSKLITQEIGYPDLLIEGKIKKKNVLSDYSYAKYQNGQLVTRSGNFPYDLNDKMFKTEVVGYSLLTIEDYNHVVYKAEKMRIILTKERVKSFDLIIGFSYIFVFFNMLLIIALSTNSLTSLWHQIQLNFENKLLLSMLFVLALSFVMVTAGTIYYNSSQFEMKHNTNINEKLESVLKNLELEEDKSSLDSSEVYSNPNKLNELLKSLSNIFYTDIHLYSFKGELVSTSRPEIFNKGLIDSLMEPEAFRQMRINEKIRFIQNEQIGKLEYSSAYALFKKGVNKDPMFINLPYFTKPVELRKEISNLIVAVINLYVVLFIVVALLSFIMANKITQPLRMIQSKFHEIELGKQSEQIVYDKKDEIGALVEEYNRMVLKLAKSIELLAKTERESAWREMAKQIAHEIKNPLTPMKLSVQFLQRAWDDKDAKFETKLQKSTQTIIDQINTLSNIATEFSNFAKMPKPNRELVDMVVRVENTVNLFTHIENLKIETNIENFDKLLIVADHEHISRVLTNLTKNAIQAVPSDREAHVQLIAEKNTETILFKVIDNGSGITEEQKEKLFIPSFTTKSSGMGMGLPIVKDIIESANGEIWFETELHKGTTFFIEFPLATQEQIEELTIS